MNAIITVSDPRGALHCPDCGEQVSYDIYGRPPGVSGRTQCHCGGVILVKREALPASLGPSEVKRAKP